MPSLAKKLDSMSRKREVEPPAIQPPSCKDSAHDVFRQPVDNMSVNVMTLDLSDFTIDFDVDVFKGARYASNSQSR